MWLFLGLAVALSATALMELGEDEAESDETTEREDQPRQVHWAASSVTEQDTLQDMLWFAQNPLMLEGNSDAPLGQDAGRFDQLGERIHSTDDDPLAEPPQPQILIGTDGPDSLLGGEADDTLIGAGGDDTLLGGGGNDRLEAGSGHNHLIGGEGDDTLIGGSGSDTLEGGWGDDLLIAGAGDNLLFGGAGQDTLVGVAFDAAGHDVSGANILNGGEGDDVLIAGQGDSLHGGEGADQFVLGDWLAQAPPAVILDYNSAEDQIVLHYDADRIAAPAVTVTFAEDDPTLAHIRLDGHVVAHVVDAKDLAADDVLLSPAPVPLPAAVAA